MRLLTTPKVTYAGLAVVMVGARVKVHAKRRAHESTIGAALVAVHAAIVATRCLAQRGPVVVILAHMLSAITVCRARSAKRASVARTSTVDAHFITVLHAVSAGGCCTLPGVFVADMGNRAILRGLAIATTRVEIPRDRTRFLDTGEPVSRLVNDSALLYDHVIPRSGTVVNAGRERDDCLATSDTDTTARNIIVGVAKGWVDVVTAELSHPEEGVITPQLNNSLTRLNKLTE
mmetsp:Transcript_45263/g.108178  ORF Transcript_45263/g.108178 Transcript_45263/m.108178 type:complete len:233 (-) Transcript_45263:864-1562(-)